MKLRIQSERSFWLFATAVFALLACANYLPFLSGRVPFPKDLVVTFPPWERFQQSDAPRSYADVGDLAVAFYPFRLYAAEAVRSGTLPLWNPYILTGTPFLANAQSALFYPPNFLYYILPVPVAWTLCFLIRMFLAALFMALLVRSLGGSRTGTILSGMIFSSCGFMTAWQGQPLGDTAIWLPMICYAVNRLHFDCSRRSLALFGAAFAMPILAGHPETAVHVVLVGLAMGAFLWVFPANPGVQAFDTRFAKWFVLGGLLAIGLASVQMIPIAEWLGQMERHLGMIWPALATDQASALVSRDVFRSPNSAGIRMPEGTSYLGMLTLLAASLAPFHAARRHVVFFVVLTVAAFCIAYSIQPMFWLASHTPILGTLKNGRFVLVGSFGIAALAGLGISIVERQSTSLSGRKRALALASLGTAFLLSVFLVYKLQQATLFNVEFMRRPSFSMGLLIASVIPILWGLSGGLRGRRFSTVICALAAFDFVSFSYGAVGFSKPGEIFPPAPLFSFLQEALAGSGHRVAKIKFAYPENTPMMFGIPEADGYEIALARPKMFWRGLSEDRMDGVILAPEPVLKSQDRRLDIANVKYLLVYAPESEPFSKSERFSLAFENGNIAVFENKSVLPHAFAVPASGIEVIPDLDRQLKRLKDASFNPEQSVITARQPPSLDNLSEKGEATGTSHIDMTEIGSQAVAFRTQTSEPSILVLSQTYYPGWVATVDGNEVPVFPADLAFTGISLPEGTHDVRFVFRPVSFRIGMGFTILSLIVLGGLVLIKMPTMERSIGSPAPSPRWVAAARIALLGLLVALAAESVFELKDRIGTELHPEADEIALYDQRVRQLLAFLPKAGEIGYLGDGSEDDVISNSAAVRTFYLTQYALAPLVLRPGTANEFVIGNFSNAKSAAVQTAGLRVIKDFGGGLMLLRGRKH